MFVTFANLAVKIFFHRFLLVEVKSFFSLLVWWKKFLSLQVFFHRIHRIERKSYTFTQIHGKSYIF